MTQAIRTIRIATQGPAGPAGLYPHAHWDSGSVPYARSSVLAHSGGVWLALRDNSVEPSSSVPDDWASWLDFSGFATLGDDGKIPASELPAIAITDTFAAASQAAMLVLAAQKGDIAIRSDLSRSFVLAADDGSVLANWKELLTPTDTVLSVAGRTGAVTLAASDISGLAASATTDTTNASNLTSGTLSNSRLSGVALAANDLSDLANAATARSNLGLGALATLNVGSGLASGGGNLSANVTSVAGRTGAVSLAQADIAGLTTASAVAFSSLALGGATLGGNALALTGTAAVSGGLSVNGGALGTHVQMNVIGGMVVGGTDGSSSFNAYGNLQVLNDASGTVRLYSGTPLQWSTDTSFSRISAGLIGVGTGAAGSVAGSLSLTNLKAAGSQIDFTGVPASDPHVVGRLWANSGVLTVSAG